jgi:hypothetical protein
MTCISLSNNQNSHLFGFCFGGSQNLLIFKSIENNWYGNRNYNKKIELDVYHFSSSVLLRANKVKMVESTIEVAVLLNSSKTIK